MSNRARQVLYTIITYSLYVFFAVLFILSVFVPIYRVVALKQKGAFDLNILTVVGAVSGCLSMILAVIFQKNSNESIKRVEVTINNINETLISVKTLAEVIEKRQPVINAIATVPYSGMSPQKLDTTWAVDSSK